MSPFVIRLSLKRLGGLLARRVWAGGILYQVLLHLLLACIISSRWLVHTVLYSLLCRCSVSFCHLHRSSGASLTLRRQFQTANGACSLADIMRGVSAKNDPSSNCSNFRLPWTLSPIRRLKPPYEKSSPTYTFHVHCVDMICVLSPRQFQPANGACFLADIVRTCTWGNSWAYPFLVCVARSCWRQTTWSRATGVLLRSHS